MKELRDDDKKFLLDEDDLLLELKMSEDDPLFEKKKYILQKKGLDHMEQVYLKGTASPDWIITTLESLLQRARTIQLNELELYFSDLAVYPPAEFYSPRNELEALNSILSAIKISVSCATDKKITALEDLHAATLNLIRDFGAKYRDDMNMIANHSCDKENQLIHWGVCNGVKTKLHIAYFEGAGRGAVALEDLEVGDVALEIPVSNIISEDLVFESDMHPVLASIDGISSETIMLLWSMKEKFNNNSRFKIYFDTLPETFNTGLSFGLDAITSLEGTSLLDKIVEAKEHLRSQYEELFPALCSRYPAIFPPEMYTWEQFLWACELWYSNGMRVMFPDGSLRTCLIPIAGFLNHSICPHILRYGRVDPTMKSLKFTMSRPCKVGDQCYLGYGNLPTSDLITFYGFIPQGCNTSDVICLDISDHESSCENSMNSRQQDHMVRGTWNSHNREIFYYGLPPPLLEDLREAQCPQHCTNNLTLGNLENEIEVLENLRSTFDALMDVLGDPALDDRTNCCWDVKLAFDFKDIERGILSSVISSCDDGIYLVKEEYRNCMTEDIRG